MSILMIILVFGVVGIVKYLVGDLLVVIIRKRLGIVLVIRESRMLLLKNLGSRRKH